jgi:putative ABC transport system permease protein
VLISALDLKLLRDLRNIAGQGLAIAAVIACGIMAYAMNHSLISSLDLTLNTYYERQNFAHLFAVLKRAPLALAARLAELPGVARVEPRIVRDVTLDVPGLAEPAIGRLISLPEFPTEANLNQVYLRTGRLPNPDRDDEALASEAFMLKHEFPLGTTIAAVINGRKKKIKLVGSALSPEYIFQMRGGEMFPDEKRFGVLWMPRRALEGAFEMRGAFNEVSLKVMPGASEPELLRRIDLLTADYGGQGAYGRADHLSHNFVSNEMNQLRSLGSIAPTIFLAVAAFLLNVVLTRIISTQREQIAALKAFGYSNLVVGWHYFKMALAITIVGYIMGLIGGQRLGVWVAELYSRFFHFPILLFRFDPEVIVRAGFISFLVALIGTWVAVRQAAVLPPAEAMRPPAPANYRPTLIERLGLGNLLSPASRMILRHLERKPWHAMLSIVGISMSVAILIMGFFIADAFDYIVDIQFYYSQREDVTVSFFEPRPHRVVHELTQLPGVTTVEPFRSVAARLRRGPRQRRIGIMGLEAEPRIHRLVDQNIRPVTLPTEGLTLSKKLAEILDAQVGDLVTVEVMEGQRPVRQVPVTMIVAEFIGMGAYMERNALNRMMNEGASVSGGFLLAEDQSLDELYRKLKERPQVGSVTVQKASIKNFEEIQQENMRIIRTFYIAFGCIIAFGVVYNTAQVSLAERHRELASLRVLGFTRGEISAILLGELAILTLAAQPVGMVFGWGLAHMIASSVDTEQIRIPVIIESATFASAALVVILAAIFSAFVVRRKLDHLDLVGVLKMQN